jgi:hypothetical protein
MAAILRARRRTLVAMVAVACLTSCSQVGPATGPSDPVAGRPAAAAGYGRLVTVPGPSGRTPILFIGASYTAGVGARTPGDGFAPRVARDLGRPAYIDAVPGSGFLNPAGIRGGEFAARLRRLRLPGRPGIVLFQGGRNDTGYPGPALARAADEALRLAGALFPGAQVVVLGPVPGHLPVSSALLSVDATLRAVATRDGATYVDPIRAGWMTHGNLPGFSGVVRDHPNDVGYAYVARRVVTALSGGRPDPGAAVARVSSAPGHGPAKPSPAGRPAVSVPSGA